VPAGGWVMLCDDLDGTGMWAEDFDFGFGDWRLLMNHIMKSLLLGSFSISVLTLIPQLNNFCLTATAVPLQAVD
jgi:hypothetical protein